MPGPPYCPVLSFKLVQQVDLGSKCAIKYRSLFETVIYYPNNRCNLCDERSSSWSFELEQTLQTQATRHVQGSFLLRRCQNPGDLSPRLVKDGPIRDLL